MKAVVKKLAVTLGMLLVATVLTGNAFAACGDLAKIKPSALFMPPLSGEPSAHLMLASASDGGAPIVGLWKVLHTSDLGAPLVQSYQQFHSDGLEIDTPDFAPGVCMGTWKQTTEARTVKIFHVGFTPGDPSGSYRGELRELITVSPDRNTFEGWYQWKFFDREGNYLFEDKGTLQGTRLSIDLF